MYCPRCAEPLMCLGGLQNNMMPQQPRQHSSITHLQKLCWPYETLSLAETYPSHEKHITTCVLPMPQAQLCPTEKSTTGWQ